MINLENRHREICRGTSVTVKLSVNMKNNLKFKNNKCS